MANEASNYCGGRGLPPYLLCRYDSDSTDYSDGASGIFLSSIPTISTRGSCCSSISMDTCSVSSTSTRSIMPNSYTTSDFLNSTELETNLSRSSFWVNDETRTIRSMCGSIDNGSETTTNSICLDDSVNRKSDEDSSSVTYLKNIPIIIAPSSENYNNDSMDVTNTNNFASNSYADPETMFPPYEPYLDQNGVEEQWKESTVKLNYLVVFYTIIMIIFRKHAMQ